MNPPVPHDPRQSPRRCLLSPLHLLELLSPGCVGPACGSFLPELEYHPSVNWRLSGHYFFTNPFVHRFALNPELEGKRLVQKSKHQIVAQALYSNPKSGSLSLQERYAGAAFDDDRNLFRLGGYFVLDVVGTHRMGECCEAFLGVTNLFDRKYPISTRPNRIGTPLTLFRGIRLCLPGD